MCPICGEPKRIDRTTCGNQMCLNEMAVRRYQDPYYKENNRKKTIEGLKEWREWKQRMNEKAAR